MSDEVFITMSDEVFITVSDEPSRMFLINYSILSPYRTITKCLLLGLSL